MIYLLIMWSFSVLTYAWRTHLYISFLCFVCSYNLSRCGRRSCLQHRIMGTQRRWSAARTWRFFMSLCNWRTSASSTPSTDTSWEKGIEPSLFKALLLPSPRADISEEFLVFSSCWDCCFLFYNSCFAWCLILCFTEHAGTRWRWQGLSVSPVPTLSHRPENSLSRSGQTLIYCQSFGYVINLL